MKTKYIKVKVSDRLPSESGIYDTNLGCYEFDTESKEFYYKGTGMTANPEYWYEKVPDYEDEAVELIEKINSIENGVFGLKSFSPELLKEEIKSFLQKVNNKK